MLTHFGTLFAVCHNYDSLTQHLTHFNTPLTLLKFHKINVSRGTLAKWMFHVEQKMWMPKNVSRGTISVNNS